MSLALPDGWYLSLKGCGEAEKRLRALRMETNNRRQGARSRRDWERHNAFFEEISLGIEEVLERKRVLSEDDRHDKELIRQLRQFVSEDDFLLCVERAKLIREAEQTRSGERGVGSAIGVLATTGGFKQRKTG